MPEFITEIKIGRDQYPITTDDVFMDNGSCMQLMYRHPLRGSGRGLNLAPLSMAMANKINKYPQVTFEHNYGKSVHCFSIKPMEA